MDLHRRERIRSRSAHGVASRETNDEGRRPGHDGGGLERARGPSSVRVADCVGKEGRVDDVMRVGENVYLNYTYYINILEDCVLELYILY